MEMTNVTVCSAGKKQQSTSDYPSDLDQIKAIDVLISTGYIWKSESIKKRNRLLEGKYELWVSVKKRKNYSKVTPELIDNLREWIGNHPQVVNSPIYNDTFLVPDHKKPRKKITVSKLLLHISIRELHNYLISKSSIYKLKEAIYESIGKTLISDTSLRALMHNNFQK